MPIGSNCVVQSQLTAHKQRKPSGNVPYMLPFVTLLFNTCLTLDCHDYYPRHLNHHPP